ncbi:MAG TPA: hypothetical protein PLG50_15415 [bacterium]|nr:hypothetical protein [bacterium]HQG47047.1 hypothetical protein [bacterium]HQI49633.1 hypothetical protein [bacterium]HQJ65667.1 hypothetical protein [bacterium]
MAEKIRPFLAINKQWMIKKILVTYFRAKNTFANIDREVQSGHDVEFDRILKLSNVLYVIKQDMHLLFQRSWPGKQGAGNDYEKVQPNSLEVELINNVGLLFHKAMVLREQAYILEHYSDASSDGSATRANMNSYIDKIRALFQQGLAIITKLLHDYRDNEVLLNYMITNEHYIRFVFGEDLDTLLRRMHGRQIDKAYLLAAKFCLNSGWEEGGRKCLQEALRINPGNQKAQNLLLDVK